MRAKYIQVGEIVRPQGLAGECKARPDTDDPNRFEKLSYVLLKDEKGEFSELPLLSARVRDGYVYLTFEGASSREDAERLRGRTLWVRREDAVTLCDNQDFICELIGCKAITESGRELGEVEDVRQYPANDVFTLIAAEGKRITFPALKSVILSTDTEKGLITVDEEKLREVALFDEN